MYPPIDRLGVGVTAPKAGASSRTPNCSRGGLPPLFRLLAQPRCSVLAPVPLIRSHRGTGSPHFPAEAAPGSLHCAARRAKWRRGRNSRAAPIGMTVWGDCGIAARAPRSFTPHSAHAIFNRVLPEWRNWQTQQTQNLPGITPRVGSTPSSGTIILPHK